MIKKLLSALLVLGTVLSLTGCIVAVPRRACASGWYWNGSRCALSSRRIYYRRAPARTPPRVIIRNHRR